MLWRSWGVPLCSVGIERRETARPLVAVPPAVRGGRLGEARMEESILRFAVPPAVRGRGRLGEARMEESILHFAVPPVQGDV